jgi:hypothetical protein
LDFTTLEWAQISAIFIWSGFARTAIGFGGAALSLPLMLLIRNDPLLFLPIVAIHLLVFSMATAAGRLKHIDWGFVKSAMQWMLIPKLAGVIGLLSLPARWMAFFVFAVTMFYAVAWILKRNFRGGAKWWDRSLLVVGGYVSGASLVGSPLIAAVAIKKVALNAYRDTLFVIWFFLVIIKITAFVVAGVDLRLIWALWLLAPASIGHVIGLRFHKHLIGHNAATVKRYLGVGLLFVSAIGLWRLSAAGG